MKKKVNLTEDQVKQEISRLLETSSTVDGQAVLARGATNSVASGLSCHHTTVSRIWKKARTNRADPCVQAYRATPQKHRCGRKRKYDDAELAEAVAKVPANQRRSERALAAAVGIPKTTLHHYKTRDNLIRPHSNALKPHLTPLHKEMRMGYAASRVLPKEEARGVVHDVSDADDGTYSDYVFNSAYDEVHVDEKWFFITEKEMKIYLARDEKPPKRSVTNKDSVTKVMSLCAVARPRFDSNGCCTFDGKIGVWPFVETVIAQRGSRHRPKGTPELKPVKVTGKVHKQCALEKVLPAVRRRWPERGTVRLQHDNAPAHFTKEDPEWLEAASRAGRVQFQLIEQGANSPDTNVLDLGFFCPLQTLQFQQKRATHVEGLIANVERAYELHEPQKLGRSWLTHQSVLDCIVRCDGDNDYSIPHLNKDRICREGNLPCHLPLTGLAKEHLERAGFL